MNLAVKNFLNLIFILSLDHNEWRHRYVVIIMILTFAILDLGRQELFSHFSAWEQWSVLGNACYKSSRLAVI